MDNFQDPDYEITQLAKEQIRVREEAEKSRCVDSVKSIIRREFQRELEFREKQLELIQRRITKAAKTLHLLRYCLVTSYYNRNELHFNASQTDLPLLDGQNRIHPAVKKLLGNNPAEFRSTLGLRKKRSMQKKGGNTVIQESNEITLKKEIEENETTSAESPVESSQSESTVIDESCNNSVRNRKLYKHQIVVGNISKWAPSESPDDNSTHKWMMYVRGPKEFPDISHIVQKVIFFLHPSYKPNDVIEISKSPFHLSRRGWGEFPLRVQLYFHGKMNKPIDLIHNLKLDKTYTGRQTLGNETVIELSLYDLAKSNASSASTKVNIQSNQPQTKIENMNQIVHKPEDVQNTNDLELQQDQIDIKVEIEPTIVSYINLDHSYCQSDTDNTRTTKTRSMEIQTDDNSKKRFVLEEVTMDSLLQIVKKRKPQQSLLKNSVLKKLKIETDNTQNSEL